MTYPTANPFLPSSPAYRLPLTRVINPVSAQNTDGVASPIAIGRNNDQLNSPVHASHYVGSARGAVYAASFATTTGGEPLQAAGTTSGLMVYNPTGNNIVMEILEILVMPKTAASNVVAGLFLEYGAPPSVVGTAVTPVPLLVGGTVLSAQGKASYGSTIAAMTFLQWLPTMMMTTTTTVSGGSQALYKPEGSLLISPGGAFNIGSTASQGANWLQHVTWAEWPI